MVKSVTIPSLMFLQIKSLETLPLSLARWKGYYDLEIQLFKVTRMCLNGASDLMMDILFVPIFCLWYCNLQMGVMEVCVSFSICS